MVLNGENIKSPVARVKTIFLNLTLLSVSAAFALMLANALVATFASRFACEAPIYNIFLSHSERGWTTQPNLRTRLCVFEYEYDVQTNDRGFRDAPWPKTGDKHILLLGDSFTFGVPLPIGQGIAQKLERLGKGQLAVYNGGVINYGLVNVLPTLSEVCKEFRFDHVIYLYFFNDIRDYGMDLNAYRVVKGNLVSARKSDGSIYSDQEINSKLARLVEPGFPLQNFFTLWHLRVILADLYVHPRQLLEQWQFFVQRSNYLNRYIKTTGEHSHERLKEATDLLLQIQNVAGKCGAKFTMMVLPTLQEAFYGIREPGTDRFLAMLNGKVSVVDMRNWTVPGTYLHIHSDGHLNESGTALAAELLRLAIEGQETKKSRDVLLRQEPKQTDKLSWHSGGTDDDRVFALVEKGQRWSVKPSLRRRMAGG